VRVLSGQRDFTVQRLIDAAYDPYLTEFAELTPRLIAAYDAASATDPRKAALAEPIAALRGWDYRWSGTSVPTALSVVWGEILWDKAAPQARAAGATVFTALRAATAGQQLDALTEAVQRLDHDFGTWKTPWGQINRFQRLDDAIAPHFDDAKPSIPVSFTSANWGSLASFKAVRTGTTKYYGVNGNSFVAAVEFGPRVHARAVTAGGESGDPASPHFGDQAQRYASGNLREVYFYPDELAGHTQRTYRPGGALSPLH
jgi:acyl-homoserine-lactone acylase